jgi:transcriptional regulator with XRE-family HTH domain
MTTRTTFADALCRRRLSIPVSQDVLADAVGCTLAAICNYERGFRTPTLYLASRVARLLDMPDELRTFHTLTADTTAPAALRGDLRSSNPGPLGRAKRRKLKPGTTNDDGNYRVSQDFAEMVTDAAARRRYDLDKLAEEAELPRGFRRKIFDTRYKNLPLVNAANIVQVLGLPVLLSDFADDDVQPIKPVTE